MVLILYLMLPEQFTFSLDDPPSPNLLWEDHLELISNAWGEEKNWKQTTFCVNNLKLLIV